jgi:hypothetical protein
MRPPALAALAVLAVVAAATLAGTAGARTAAVPANTSQPLIQGDAVVGRTITTSNGLWSSSPTSYAYQWQRCTAEARGCGNIGGATSRSYTLRSEDVGHQVRALVTARNADGAATVNSQPSGVVSDGSAPRLTAAPTIVGTAKAGETLTANRGTWSTGTSGFRYQWMTCDAGGATCASIAGATGTTYGVRAADAGKTIRVVVTATSAGGETTATSAQTAAVAPLAGPAANPAPASANPCARVASGSTSAVAIENVSLPNRLVISSLEFAPRVLSTKNPFLGRFRVTDSCGRPVANALVYVTGVPFGRLAAAPEMRTDGSGWATMQLSPTARLPLTRGGAVVMFVRARKPGDSVLAGVSTRRLVQLPTTR